MYYYVLHCITFGCEDNTINWFFQGFAVVFSVVFADGVVVLVGVGDDAVVLGPDAFDRYFHAEGGREVVAHGGTDAVGGHHVVVASPDPSKGRGAEVVHQYVRTIEAVAVVAEAGTVIVGDVFLGIDVGRPPLVEAVACHDVEAAVAIGVAAVDDVVDATAGSHPQLVVDGLQPCGRERLSESSAVAGVLAERGEGRQVELDVEALVQPGKCSPPPTPPQGSGDATSSIYKAFLRWWSGCGRVGLCEACEACSHGEYDDKQSFHNCLQK